MEYKLTRQGYADALIELAPKIEELVVLDADVAKATKTCDFEEIYPERFFNCGTAEQNELSVAAGMAIEGLLPFATTFGMFATKRAADQLRNSICYSNLNVKVGATHCGITTGGDGASHQTNEDIAIARVMPNLTVLVPGDYEEARQATIAAAYHKGPIYLRFGRDEYPVVPELHGKFEIGKAKILRNEGDVLIISTGIMASEALQAADALAEKSITASVLHMPTVKPLDVDALATLARRAKAVVTIEEHSIIGGLGEAVASFLGENFPRPMKRIGIRDVYGESGQAQELLDKYGLRARNVVEAAVLLMQTTEI